MLNTNNNPNHNSTSNEAGIVWKMAVLWSGNVVVGVLYVLCAHSSTYFETGKLRFWNTCFWTSLWLLHKKSYENNDFNWRTMSILQHSQWSVRIDVPHDLRHAPEAQKKKWKHCSECLLKLPPHILTMNTFVWKIFLKLFLWTFLMFILHNIMY